MREYANMLSEGDGIEMNKKEAARYYKLAADKGDTESMNKYSEMLSKGNGIEKNLKEAARYLKLASNQYNDE